MELFNRLGIESKHANISWGIKPVDTYSLFESRCPVTTREQVKSLNEKYYYFYVDNWEQPAKLSLMERGIKYAKVLADFDAPQELIDQCVVRQGKTTLDQHYAIDDDIRQWLEENVLNNGDNSMIILREDEEDNALKIPLPGMEDPVPEIKILELRNTPTTISKEEIHETIKKYNFYESRNNPDGDSQTYLVSGKDEFIATDKVTNLTWQRKGTEDIVSYKKLEKYIEEMNRNRYRGYDDWRLPTIEEALSLLNPVKNEKGLHVHPCFSAQQAFIFTSDQSKAKRYWFVDLHQAKIYDAQGTGSGFSGGFARLCRGGA